MTHALHHTHHFPAGMCGRVRLVGSDRIFEFACGRDGVILDNTISSPKNIFTTLVREVIDIAVDPRRQPSR